MCVNAEKGRPTDLAALANSRPAAVPFLPTVLTALVAASFSLLCQQVPGSSPTVVPSLPATIEGLELAGAVGPHRPSEGANPSTVLPATLAFGTLYPLDFDDTRMAASTKRPTSVRTAASNKRGCLAGRCADAKPAEPTRTAATPQRGQPEQPPLPFAEEIAPLPEGTLPFLPQAHAAIDAVTSFGGQAASLGGATLGSMLELR